MENTQALRTGVNSAAASLVQLLCTFAVATTSDVAERFDTTNAALAQGLASTMVTSGLAGLRADDTLESLIGRADDDLYRRLR